MPFLIILVLALPCYVYCQDTNSQIDRLQHIRAINFEKGKDFKHWTNALILDDDQLLWISGLNVLYTYDGVTISERAHVENFDNYIFDRILEINDTFFLFNINSPVHYFAYKSSDDVIRKSTWNIEAYGHCSTPQGRELISTGSGQILEYKNGKFDTLFSAISTPDNSPYNTTCRSLTLDNNDEDKIWYYHRNNLYHISIADGSYDNYNCLQNADLDLNYGNRVGYFNIDLSHIGDDLYFGSRSDGLIRFHIPTKQWYQYSKPIPPEYQGREGDVNSVISIAAYNDSILLLGGTFAPFFNIKNKQHYQYKGNYGSYNLPGLFYVIRHEDVAFAYNFLGGVTVLSSSANKFDNRKIVSKTQTKSNLVSTRGLSYTSDGLYIYGVTSNNDTSHTIDVIQTIGEEVTKNLVVDKNNCVWIGTSTGLIRYNTLKNSFKKYSKSDGLDTQDWSKDFYAGLTSDGMVLVQTGDFVSTFDPDALFVVEELSQPYVHKVDVLDRTINMRSGTDHEISLAPEEDFFTIHYSLRDYHKGSTIKFEYKLESYDDDWVAGGIEHKASYKHVPPGTYSFRIRASNAEGDVTMISEAFVINAKAYWYESLLFKLAIFFVIGLIVFSFYRIKTASLKRELALRSQFNEELSQVKLEALRSQMNPHFLFNCLNSIDNFILSNDAQNASAYLGKFSKLIRNILDYSKTNAITLQEELESTELYIKMEQMRFSDKFDYSITVDQSINMQIESIPPLILQPYVENSIWHGLLHKEEKGSIHINISQDTNYYNIQIDDNGIGRQKAQSIKTKSATKRKSHGMKITEDRIRLVHQLNGQGGTVNTIDKIDDNGNPAGTTVIIKLAKSQAPPIR